MPSCLPEKKAAYAEYRRSRDEMRELLLHKQNVDRMLGKDEREEEKKRSMTGNNGHAPKAFRRNAQPHIYACSKGFRGAAPDKQRGVFAAAEIARKAKWVPLCPACRSTFAALLNLGLK